VRVNNLKACTTYEYYIQRICGDILSVPSQTDTVKTACFSSIANIQSVILAVSPNPATTMLHIHVNEPTRSDASFKVVDVHGTEIPLPVLMSDSGYRVDVSKLPSGMYVLTCHYKGSSVAMTKFVKMD